MTFSAILAATLALTPLDTPSGFAATTPWMPCEVSTYARRFDGRRTASGEIYRHDKDMTAATVRAENSLKPRVKFGTHVEIRSQHGRTIVVKINDTGSYRPSGVKQWFDLSGLAWKSLYPETNPSRYRVEYRLLERTNDDEN